LAAPGAEATSKSQRSLADQQAPMGVGTTRTLERIAASVGELQAAQPRFELVDDVPQGGVLIALPALLSIGLLRHTREHFSLPPGFYGIESIFLVLAFMALARVRSAEELRYQAPGEWGKMLGLDRIPEVRTLRKKLGLLCVEAAPSMDWSSTLAKDWMAQDPESAGTLLIDGHTRVYHGSLTPLPRHYVTRERLCLRATTDYWVNALDGQPFFVITKPVDPGLLKVMREDIVPRLKGDIPGQPTAEELQADPLRHRFTLIFDREGYSPEFFKAMKAERIAIICYHKFPGPDWPLAEFSPQSVRLSNGEVIDHDLAERGTRLSNDLWVREVRHLDAKGHQTAILTTDYRSQAPGVAAGQFGRWSQENFFKYMRDHYGLDALVEYGTSPLPDTTLVVNPAWRELDSQIRAHRGKLHRERAEFGALSLAEAGTPEQAAVFEGKKGRQLQAIQQRESDLETLKGQRKALPGKIAIKDLAPHQRFAQLSAVRKHFLDTIKLIAYRAETALVHAARETLSRLEDARSFVRSVLDSTVDLRPDTATGVLRVRFHGLATVAHNEVLSHLCAEMTATETVFPATNLRVIFDPPGPT
jgi:hypothetical protein